MHEKRAALLECVKYRLKKILISHILSMNMDFEWERKFQGTGKKKNTKKTNKNHTYAFTSRTLFNPGSNIKREITRLPFSPQFKIFKAYGVLNCGSILLMIFEIAIH